MHPATTASCSQPSFASTMKKRAVDWVKSVLVSLVNPFPNSKTPNTKSTYYPFPAPSALTYIPPPSLPLATAKPVDIPSRTCDTASKSRANSTKDEFQRIYSTIKSSESLLVECIQASGIVDNECISNSSSPSSPSSTCTYTTTSPISSGPPLTLTSPTLHQKHKLTLTQFTTDDDPFAKDAIQIVRGNSASSGHTHTQDRHSRASYKTQWTIGQDVPAMFPLASSFPASAYSRYSDNNNRVPEWRSLQRSRSRSFSPSPTPSPVGTGAGSNPPVHDLCESMHYWFAEASLPKSTAINSPEGDLEEDILLWALYINALELFHDPDADGGTDVNESVKLGIDPDIETEGDTGISGRFRNELTDFDKRLNLAQDSVHTSIPGGSGSFSAAKLPRLPQAQVPAYEPSPSPHLSLSFQAHTQAYHLRTVPYPQPNISAKSKSRPKSVNKSTSCPDIQEGGGMGSFGMESGTRTVGGAPRKEQRRRQRQKTAGDDWGLLAASY